MGVEYTGRQTAVTKKIKQQVEAGLTRIEKIVGAAVGVQVTLTAQKHRQIADIRIQTRSQKLVAACEASNMEAALKEALEKIERQAVRHKKKTGTIKRHPKGEVKVGHGKAVIEAVTPTVSKSTGKSSAKNPDRIKTVPMVVHSFPFQSPLPEPHIARTTEGVALRPMSVEEAVKEAAFRDRDVFIFRDYSEQLMVLHRRRDGKMELIEVP
ncbi:ribosomal subunit interface protein [Edaphobacter acidisoli]|uniref:Ribosome hibernation promoting factor n=1 Tax=Edaphobacter acidisoli TaxID=2040573 RepID=A0A916RGF1_9BACT|nr:ribosome-associated translation inhibitor RaiA [Edaphobacter acidisoli]GGA55150.1 ribosomal subunit interface protein [Edaphobacter acidisoli]